MIRTTCFRDYAGCMHLLYTDHLGNVVAKGISFIHEAIVRILGMIYPAKRLTSKTQVRPHVQVPNLMFHFYCFFRCVDYNLPICIILFLQYAPTDWST